MLLLEFVTPGFLIFFFGVGAWLVAGICFFVDISLNTQLLVFIISSILFLLFLRKWVQTMFVGHITSTQNSSEILDDFIGEKAVVTKQITPHIKGKVEFHGTNWEAEAEKTINKGIPVEIIEKNSQ